MQVNYTLLMPAFAVFFPVPTAIVATAVVHLTNNLFKLALVGRHAGRGVVVRFGIPAVAAAVAGAGALVLFAALPALASYELLGATRRLEAVELVVGTLIVGFALLELSPTFADIELGRSSADADRGQGP